MKFIFRTSKIITAILCLIILASCGSKELNYEKYANHKNVVEDSSYGNIKMTFDNLDGQDIRSFKTKPGTVYKFNYKYEIKKGDLRVQFTDSEGNALEEVGWASEVEKELKKEEKAGEEINLNGAGGSKDVKSTDDVIKVIIEGKDAGGLVSIKW